MLSQMDARELAEYMAFDLIEPVGELRADMRAGIVASTIANCNRGRGQSAFSPSDFMPYFKEDGQDGQMDNEQMHDVMKHALTMLKPGGH